MINKKVLLINGNRHEVEIIEEIFHSMVVKPHLLVVENGQEALHVLMGSPQEQIENNFAAKKIRPDIILLDKDLTDMSGFEFLEIMRKYYSLENIKIFLLADLSDEHDRMLSEKFAITGYLQRPFENNPTTIENFKSAVEGLNGSKSYMIFSLVSMKAKFSNWLGMIKKSILKGKVTTLKMGSSAIIKIAVCVTCVSIIGGAAIYKENKSSEVSHAKISKLEASTNLISVKADSTELKTTAYRNYAGLYSVELGELDLKSDHTLSFFSSSTSVNPYYESAGSWKLENDSTITAIFFKDSVTIHYKILSDREIAAQEIRAAFDNKAIPVAYTPYSSSLIRTKGYYPDGKVEWAIADRWKNNYLNQKLCGNCIYYFPTGEILSKGHIKNGLKEGRWKYYDKSGRKIKTEFYRDGAIARMKNLPGFKNY